ncbi:MAG: helix-turn-helix domain-containing protein [Bacteroidota bacterium]
MNLSDVLLIIISSAGLLHGLAFALYLAFFKKKKLLSNYFLAAILLFMGFRIGKSVMLNFGNDMEPVFIFAGLALLLLIGPLLRWYAKAMTVVNFKVPKAYYLELLPFLLIFVSSLFIKKEWYDENNKHAVIVFGSALIFIYLHFAFYIFTVSRLLRAVKKCYEKAERTKSQKAIISWLQLLIIGFAIIWLSYAFNIIDEAVPYIVGPLLYSVVIYFLSIKAYQLKVTDLDGNVFKKNDDLELFIFIKDIMSKEKLYLDHDVSLAKIGKLIQKNTQKTSEVINQYAKRNFNDFINQFRIEEAKNILRTHHNVTISSIAYDVGFSSLSSFNTAFKKLEGTTPSAFRKDQIT